MYENDEQRESHERVRAFSELRTSEYMWIKHQHNHLKNQLTSKSAELKVALDNPQQCLGFLNLLRDVEFLYMQVGAYEDAVNDFNNMIKGEK